MHFKGEVCLNQNVLGIMENHEKAEMYFRIAIIDGRIERIINEIHAKQVELAHELLAEAMQGQHFNLHLTRYDRSSICFHEDIVDEVSSSYNGDSTIYCKLYELTGPRDFELPSLKIQFSMDPEDYGDNEVSAHFSPVSYDFSGMKPSKLHELAQYMEKFHFISETCHGIAKALLPIAEERKHELHTLYKSGFHLREELEIN